MRRFNVEIAVGIFLVVGFLCFAYLAVRLGDVPLFGTHTYIVKARFGSVSGLKQGDNVEVAGVRVGKVAYIRLDDKTYQAVVGMAIAPDLHLSEDTIASVRTSGIIGDKYISLSPGGMPQYIKPGGTITETESAINLESLISKYIFQKK